MWRRYIVGGLGEHVTFFFVLFFYIYLTKNMCIDTNIRCLTVLIVMMHT